MHERLFRDMIFDFQLSCLETVFLEMLAIMSGINVMTHRSYAPSHSAEGYLFHV
jgi:hypothetical protein